MKRLLTVSRLLLIVAVLGAGAPAAYAQLEPMRPREEVPFELSVSQEFSAEGQPLLVVSTSIPYRQLVFFVRGPAFESRYRVYMELKDGRGRSVRGEVWEETVSVATYKETTSPTVSATSRKSFPVAPGDYRVTVTVEVIDTSRRFSRDGAVRIVGQGTGMIGVSAPVFYTFSGDSAAARSPAGQIVVSRCRIEEVKRLRINPNAIYGDFSSWVRVLYNVVTATKEGEGSHTLLTRVRDSRGRVVLYNRTPLGRSEGGHYTVCVDVNVDDFVIGQYDIDAVIEGAAELGTGTSHGSFTVLINRGLLGEHFTDLVEIITPIASDAEREAFAKTPPDRRMQAWADFWKKRDATPSAGGNDAFGEYLQRLKVVVRSFSKLAPGWKTDMGRVYLRNGQPDKVEDRSPAPGPMQNVIGQSYQLWYYNSQGIVYIFEDAIGNGDYRLLTTRNM